MDPQPKMNPTLTTETHKRCHCYLRVAGISSPQKRERLIESSYQSGKDPLIALHEYLVEEQREKRLPAQLSETGTSMKEAPFRFFWEKQPSSPVQLRPTKRARALENFFAEIRVWILSAVRTR